MKGQEIINHAVRAEMPDREALRESCIRQATRKSTVKHSVWVKRLIPAAACLAVVIAALIAFPSLYGNLNGTPPSTQPGTTQTDETKPSSTKQNDKVTAHEFTANDIPAPDAAMTGMFNLSGDDYIKMTYEEITDYFGAALPIAELLPALSLQPKTKDYPYGIYKSDSKYPVWDGDTLVESKEPRGIYYDVNSFLFASADGKQSLGIHLDKVFHYPTYNFISALEKVEKLTFSQINGRELAVFHFTEDKNDCYYVEFVNGEVSYCVGSSNLSREDFFKCLTALVKETAPVTNPRTIIGKTGAIDDYACYIAVECDNGTGYGVHLPQGEAEKYTIFQEVKVVFNGEPATIGHIWRQQLVSFKAVEN